jgi:hypothetical protein
MAKGSNTQFNIRASEDLLKRLTAAGKKRGVTAATEASIRLQESFDTQAQKQAVETTISSTADAVAQQVTDDLMKKIEALVIKIVTTEITKRSS